MKNIVTIPCKTIRAMARNMSKGSYWACVLVVILTDLIVELPQEILGHFFELTRTSLVAGVYTSTYTAAGVISNVYGFVMEATLKLGLASFALAVIRGRGAHLDNVTAAFKFWGKAALAELISTVQIALRTLLLIVPGVICYYGHSQIMYVLAEHPDYTAMQAIDASHHMMEGNKMKLFKLELSFIGWELLASLPVNIYTAIRATKLNLFITTDIAQYYSKLAEILEEPLVGVFNWLMIFVTAYILFTKAVFYDLASGSISVVEGETENLAAVVRITPEEADEVFEEAQDTQAEENEETYTAVSDDETTEDKE